MGVPLEGELTDSLSSVWSEYARNQ